MGGSLHSWHQLYSRVYICTVLIKYLGFELTGQAIKHNQMTAARLSVGLSFLTSLSMVLKLEKGTALPVAIYSTTENCASRE